MSQRPRLAGDGRLELPSKIAFDHHGFIQGRFADRTIDPFDWTEDRLLLAESFARLARPDRRAVGPGGPARAVDHIDFTGGAGEYRRARGLARDVRPTLHGESGVAEQTGQHVWHLATLARLTEHRSTGDWDPRWGIRDRQPEGGSSWVAQSRRELKSRHLSSNCAGPHTRDRSAVRRGAGSSVAAWRVWSCRHVHEPGWFGHCRRPMANMAIASLTKRERPGPWVRPGIPWSSWSAS